MKRVAAHFRTIAVILLSLIVVLEIGFISLRNPLRVDLSDSQLYKLSSRTQSILEQLDRPVKILVLFSKEDAQNDPRVEKELEDLSFDMRHLLEEYESQSRRISVEWVDPYQDTSYTRDLAVKYSLVKPDGTADLPAVVFDMNEGTRTKIVRLPDLIERRRSEDGTEAPINVFKGEQAFTSALYELVQGENPTIYFLTGHGEGSLNDDDRLWGLSELRAMAPRGNMVFQELVLGSQSEIPLDTDVLVIPGPRENLDGYELNRIEEYLAQGGRLLVLLNDGTETGLESLLERWQIGVMNVIVTDPTARQQRSDVVVEHTYFNFDHPITQALVAESLDIVFYKPQIVYPLGGTQTPTKADQLFIPWGNSYVEVAGKRIPPCLGAAAEREVRRGLGGQPALSKVVVIGDSDFISNAALGLRGNAELFMASLDWLLDRDIVISPKSAEEVRPDLTRKQIVNLFWINIAGIPAIAVVLALLTGYRRRK